MREIAGKTLAAAMVFAALAVRPAEAAGFFKEAHLSPSLVQTNGTPRVGSGMFFGYRSADEGPGDDAFRMCLEAAQKENIPLVLIWSNHDCIYCSRFASRMNRRAAEASEWMKRTPALFAYFKGRGGKVHPLAEHGPAACSEAYWFAWNMGARPGWPLCVIYHLRKDGTVSAKVTSLMKSDPVQFMKTVDAFLAAQKEAR